MPNPVSNLADEYSRVWLALASISGLFIGQIIPDDDDEEKEEDALGGCAEVGRNDLVSLLDQIKVLIPVLHVM